MPPKSSKGTGRPRPAGLGTSRVLSGCHVSGRVWIQRGKKTYLSWGRVVLLERIRDHGSISAAARSMGMGYRHAWELADEMNRGPVPLLRKKMGGAGGGGTELTPAGEAAIEGWWRLVDEFSEWISGRDPKVWKSPRAAEGRRHGRRRKK